MSLFEAYKR